MALCSTRPYEHTFSTVGQLDSLIVMHPLRIATSDWEDDMRKLTELTYLDVFNYFSQS